MLIEIDKMLAGDIKALNHLSLKNCAAYKVRFGIAETLFSRNFSKFTEYEISFEYRIYEY